MLSSTAATRWPWVMLPARTVLFFLFQALIAVGFLLAGSAAAWTASAAWWPMTVTLTNLVCLALLTRMYRQEGCRFWDIFRIDRKHWKGDLLALLGVLLVTGPVAMLPGNLLATALFGDSMAPMKQFLVPLPALGIFTAILLFPVTQGLAELSTYFLYVMPRLEKLTGKPWLAYGLASFFLGIQHMMAPLLFDGRFMLWRALMFIPFAFLIGAVLKWRPRLLPYVAVVHILMDMATGAMYLMPM